MKRARTSVLHVAFYPTLLETRHIMLENDGHAVISALGNDEAMARAKAAESPFDVIVVGFSAPSKTRGSIVQWMKHNVPETPVVVLLARDGESFPDADFVTFSENPRVWLDAVRHACVK